MTDSSEVHPLQFCAFSSRIDLPFYATFFDAKLNLDKLDESVRPLLGVYRPKGRTGEAFMEIHASALTEQKAPAGYVRAEGKLKNVNTIESFKSLDKSAILTDLGRQIFEAIHDGTIYSAPSLLSSFFVISYANLKKYSFTYWFGFAAIHSDPSWKRCGPILHLTPLESEALVEAVGTWKYSVDVRQHGYFLAKKGRPGSNSDEDNDSTWTIGTLRDFETGFFDNVTESDRYICFVDPSGITDAPGWPLRNLLVLIRHRYQLRKVQILCYRDVHARREDARSIVIRAELEQVEKMSLDKLPKVTGWERNPDNKLMSRTLSLTEYMDPNVLSAQAVDLNLKLMRWRIAPTLDLDAIKDCKCLLLGAGTLGGYVARSLLAWGVRQITFVDNGKVSYSNPVRQPLYNFEDCKDGGMFKAIQAAEALRRIHPGVKSEGHVLTVPMLGHPILPDQESKVKEDFYELVRLISGHDAVFLLMDTREARWLPTLMAKSRDKIVLNAALAFDSFLAMRHGGREDGRKRAEGESVAPKSLGCYFCNDVVAPSDSMRNQTLDQQCTVTRAGVALSASATLVEMFVSIMQHPQRHHADAPLGTASAAGADALLDPPDHPLGLVPHQVRGYFSVFRNMILRGESYKHCSACSPPVIEDYDRNGWAFVQKVLEDPNYILRVSGLEKVQKSAEKLISDGTFDMDDDEDEEMGGEGVLL